MRNWSVISVSGSISPLGFGLDSLQAMVEQLGNIKETRNIHQQQRKEQTTCAHDFDAVVWFKQVQAARYRKGQVHDLPD